jgi:hypothetical protein
MLWFSIALFAAGVLQILYYRKIARWLYTVQRPLFKVAYSWLVDVDAGWFRKSYDVGMFLMGVMLLLGAYVVYCVPITL